MTTTKARLSRRNFLLAVGAGTAATSAAIVSNNKTDRAASQKPVESKKGYQLTEHVRNYYRTTRI